MCLILDSRMPDYCNPVYARDFPDPFVFLHKATYYAVATGKRREVPGAEGFAEPSVFPLLKSKNLTDWQSLGYAMKRPDESLGNSFWAPEIAFHEGRFYLYYSVGFGDKRHHLRVAVSERPEGPYIDLGTPLTDLEQCPFAIDADPFQDDDGQWYLFYARDFLDAEGGVRAGTALVVDRLLEMTRLAGEERVVLRARHDWQCYQKDREMYGRTFDCVVPKRLCPH